MIMVALVLSCVINGDSITGILEQATRLTTALIILIVLWVAASVWAPKAISRFKETIVPLACPMEEGTAGNRGN
ncbi:hypothetical protein [Streptomyces sp. HB2AG]|uniref:hypothetical protein n=1 Tax=Streptomyces sp. HB2AG TaxID=2983400 RepID=UPI0022AAEA09|nr:hypothetical protein [Streptomyces sp. HB2AG]MCZ2527770.1 hypothetical protein [Streptomyces sp. HB2AG]